jgi:hypothetical protein
MSNFIFLDILSTRVILSSALGCCIHSFSVSLIQITFFKFICTSILPFFNFIGYFVRINANLFTILPAFFLIIIIFLLFFEVSKINYNFHLLFILFQVLICYLTLLHMLINIESLIFSLTNF